MCAAPHSPRRRKLDLRMKSFSLDSPESTEHAQRRRYNHGSQSHSTSHSQCKQKFTIFQIYSFFFVKKEIYSPFYLSLCANVSLCFTYTSWQLHKSLFSLFYIHIHLFIQHSNISIIFLNVFGERIIIIYEVFCLFLSS